MQFRFVGDSNKEICVTVRITNRSHQRYAFKMKCTRNDLFKIRPPTGLIDPGKQQDVLVLFKFPSSSFSDSAVAGVP